MIVGVITPSMSNGQGELLNGPSKDFAGNIYYYKNGHLHREYGPAIECVNGDKEWFLNGKLHRENGPAVEYPNGDKYWYLNGELHRKDGPAVEYANGNKYWYYHSKPIVCSSQEEFERLINLKVFW